MRQDHTLDDNGSTAVAYSGRVDTAAIYIFANGDFDSGTLTVEYSVDGTNWVPDTDATLTASGFIRFDIHPIIAFRATLAGATSPDIDITFLS